MGLFNAVTFINLKILHNLVSSRTSKSVQPDITFISNFFPGAINVFFLIPFNYCKKNGVSFVKNAFFIENEAT